MKENLETVTIAYVLDAKGMLFLVYAPPFRSSAGQAHISQFNSFIDHRSPLELIRSSAYPMSKQLTIINYDQRPPSTQEVKIGPKSTQPAMIPL